MGWVRQAANDFPGSFFESDRSAGLDRYHECVTCESAAAGIGAADRPKASRGLSGYGSSRLPEMHAQHNCRSRVACAQRDFFRIFDGKTVAEGDLLVAWGRYQVLCTQSAFAGRSASDERERYRSTYPCIDARSDGLGR